MNLNPSQKKQTTPSEEEEQPTTYDLFVGGLPSSCTAKLLDAYFTQFGEIIESLPQTWNKKSTKCRGFAIIKCADLATFHKIKGFRKHVLLGRVIECKPYFRNKEELEKHNSELHRRKIFVRGLSSKISTKDLENYFSSFGSLEICYVVKHRKSGKSKGFGYLCFKDSKDSETVLEIGEFTIKRKKINCYRYAKMKYGEGRQKNKADSRDQGRLTDGNASGESKKSSQGGEEKTSTPLIPGGLGLIGREPEDGTINPKIVPLKATGEAIKSSQKNLIKATNSLKNITNKFEFQKSHISMLPTTTGIPKKEPLADQSKLPAFKCDKRITTNCDERKKHGKYSFFGSFKSKELYRKFKTDSNLERS